MNQLTRERIEELRQHFTHPDVLTAFDMVLASLTPQPAPQDDGPMYADAKKVYEAVLAIKPSHDEFPPSEHDEMTEHHRVQHKRIQLILDFARRTPSVAQPQSDNKCKHPEDCDYPDCGTRTNPELVKCYSEDDWKLISDTLPNCKYGHMGCKCQQCMAHKALSRLMASAHSDRNAVRDGGKTEPEPDWYYCDIDPDESGDSAYEAMYHHRARLEPVELRTSYIGPTKWGVMHPSQEDDGEEATTFDTQEEAQKFCDDQRAPTSKPPSGQEKA